MTDPALFTDPARYANLSECGTYRWSLGRDWALNPRRMLIVMLNPSTADAEIDDPTIRRCVSFARRESYGGIVVVNLLPWRETDPDALARRIDVMPEAELLEVLDHNAIVTFNAIRATDGPILCAWGAHPLAADFAWRASDAGRHDLVCLGTTKTGAPRHPLYVRGDAPLIPWSPQ